jgi:hypothetical protein
VSFAGWLRSLLLVICLAVLSGCLPPTPSPSAPPPTATVTLTPTGTATIVWFPATATYTPAATQFRSPTPDLSPDLGSILLEDPFTDGKSWATSRTGIGSIAYGKNELTLAVSANRGTLLSLRKAPMLDNFYLQIDAHPSLCLNEDAYGLLLRASSNQDFYRLVLTCSGRMRLERLKGAKIVVLQDWVSSGQLLPGGMMTTRLGVYAQGQELRVFINDVYQFSTRDPVWSSGSLGVFARSSGDTPLTVSFSHLIIYHTRPGQQLPFQTAFPTASPGPTRKPISTPTP